MQKNEDLTHFLDQLFAPQGLLQKKLPAFEQRADQFAFAKTHLKLLQEGGKALVEAGTGIGKSLGYLAPALLFAFHRKEKVVVSTYTIALQEQLIKKRFPCCRSFWGSICRCDLSKGWAITSVFAS